MNDTKPDFAAQYGACVKQGCRHIRKEAHPESLQLWKICVNCGRRTAILTFTQEQWDKLVAEGRILLK